MSCIDKSDLVYVISNPFTVLHVYASVMLPITLKFDFPALMVLKAL